MASSLQVEESELKDLAAACLYLTIGTSDGGIHMHGVAYGESGTACMPESSGTVEEDARSENISGSGGSGVIGGGGGIDSKAHTSSTCPMLHAVCAAIGCLCLDSVSRMAQRVRSTLHDDLAAVSALRSVMLYLCRIGLSDGSGGGGSMPSAAASNAVNDGGDSCSGNTATLDEPATLLLPGPQSVASSTLSRIMQLARAALCDAQCLNFRPTVTAAALLYCQRLSCGLLPFWCVSLPNVHVCARIPRQSHTSINENTQNHPTMGSWMPPHLSITAGQALWPLALATAMHACQSSLRQYTVYSAFCRLKLVLTGICHLLASKRCPPMGMCVQPLCRQLCWMACLCQQSWIRPRARQPQEKQQQLQHQLLSSAQWSSATLWVMPRLMIRQLEASSRQNWISTSHVASGGDGNAAT
jgi:hypothetical protein